MPCIRFSTRADAVYYRNQHIPQGDYKIVKTRYYSMEQEKYISCYVVVYRPQLHKK